MVSTCQKTPLPNYAHDPVKILCAVRRPKFFLFNYLQPAVLINILALSVALPPPLARFVFLIPAESGEKITLGISTMLNMTVFLMTVTSGIPPTDQTPILSIYYATVMVVATNFIITAVAIATSLATTSPPPPPLPP